MVANPARRMPQSGRLIDGSSASLIHTPSALRQGRILWSGLWIYGRVLMHSKSQSRVIRKPYDQGIIVGLYPKTDGSPARRGPMPRPDFVCDQQRGSRAGSIVALPVSLAQLSLYASGCDGSVGLRAFLTLFGSRSPTFHRTY